MPKHVPFEKFDKLERRLRRIVRKGTEAQRRDALAVVIGLHGLRVSEVVNLKVGDFDPIDDTLRVMSLKRGKPRKIGLEEGLSAQLRKLCRKRDKSEPLLKTRLLKTSDGDGSVHPNQWERFARELTKELFGGDGLPFHAFRHTLAIRTYLATKDILKVKGLLGHRSMKNTEIYVEQYALMDDRRLAKFERLVRHGKFHVRPSLSDLGNKRSEAFGRTIRTGERELFETTGKRVENDTKPRERSEKRPNADPKTTSATKSRTKTTSLKSKRSGERRRKPKD